MPKQREHTTCSADWPDHDTDDCCTGTALLALLALIIVAVLLHLAGVAL